MAKDFLNVIERAMLMGLSDKINTSTTDSTSKDGSIFFYGEFPEAEEVKFPAVIIQQTASGFAEQLMGQSMTLGSSSGSGEIYGISYNIHIICERDNEIQIGSTVYKQRRLLNWIMLNVANELTDLDFSAYQEEEMEIVERRLLAWRDIGYMPEFQWYGASCDYTLTFKNFRA